MAFPLDPGRGFVSAAVNGTLAERLLDRAAQGHAHIELTLTRDTIQVRSLRRGARVPEEIRSDAVALKTALIELLQAKTPADALLSCARCGMGARSVANHSCPPLLLSRPPATRSA